MAARSGLSKISEEGTAMTTANGAEELEKEERGVVNEELELPKEKKMKRSKGRKVSVFTQEMKSRHQDNASFTMLHMDQPVASRVTFVLSQSESSENSVRKTSIQEQLRPLPNVTHQTGPKREFSVTQVRKIIKETFENTLDGNEITLPRNALCKNLTEAIKVKTRRMNYDRYRLIVHVYLCSKDNVSLKVTSRCVWDEKIDNYADYKYEAKDFYVLGVVYGIYKE